MKNKLFLSLAVTLIVLVLIPAFALASALGDSQVVAPVPGAGLPEGIATRGNRFYVSGPADFGQPLGSAYVHAYDINTGTLEDTFPINITNPYAGMSATSCAAFGPDGKLYVLEPFVGVVAMDLDPNNTQSVYSAWSPEGPLLSNDLVFDDDGNLYVTDSFAGTIYKIPAGGGAAEVWFADPRLLGAGQYPFIIGANGIRIDRNNKMVYVSVTFDAGLDGKIYRLPLVDSPDAEDLELFASLGMYTGPDGIAFGKSGKLYVAMAASNTITVLNPDGTVDAVYSGPALAPQGGTVPWVGPANIAFNDQEGTLLVTNHASLVEPRDPDLFLVFDVFVDDKGAPLK